MARCSRFSSLGGGWLSLAPPLRSALASGRGFWPGGLGGCWAVGLPCWGRHSAGALLCAFASRIGLSSPAACGCLCCSLLRFGPYLALSLGSWPAPSGGLALLRLLMLALSICSSYSSGPSLLGCCLLLLLAACWLSTHLRALGWGCSLAGLLLLGCCLPLAALPLRLGLLDLGSSLPGFLWLLPSAPSARAASWLRSLLLPLLLALAGPGAGLGGASRSSLLVMDAGSALLPSPLWLPAACCAGSGSRAPC